MPDRKPENPSAFPSGDKAAFPTATFDPGMSLRDWFAGQALSGRMINGFASSADKTIHARSSYEIADAMLAERERGQ